ncbi:LysR family transcriptional regulator [Wohlfahrtiimonas larvae]|uniref:LysR family transcriptional regulator n=1 Tax=Wohlfahrtiimonas larvae TaxID=1157986 RepID=A0ABP9MEG0_9GAMM|nr:LysR substrate-binding domain-containing protein [Wohlfahrtiimonas larvae]
MVKNHRVYYFHQAVKYGGIRNAADMMNIAPSAVSRQITLLENELKVSLLEKNLRGAVPTEAGQLVLQYFQQTLEQQEDLIASLASLQGLDQGKLIITTGEGYLRLLSKVIANFSAKHPNIEINVDVVGSNNVVRSIIENEAHIGIAFNPELNPNIRTHFEIHHPMMIFMTPNHPLNAKQHPIQLSELAEHRLALSHISHGVQQIIQKAADDDGIHLKPSLVCNYLHLLKSYASEGGIALLPNFMRYEDDKNIVLKKLEHQYFNQTQTKIMSRLGRQLPPAANKFLQEVTKIFS